MKRKRQRLGAFIMLLNSIAFFITVACPHNVRFSRNFYIEIASAGFLIGTILAHGIRKTTSRFMEILGINFYIIGWAFIENSLLVANNYLELYFNGKKEPTLVLKTENDPLKPKRNAQKNLKSTK
ncbi:hypothetical protein HNY73_020964 [Argiope bruennichi]|uniref:Uncharacterized protein n=1 Tax=Argiope bruennichi TaxID=94029 RepID=A0A8T0ECE6_ARGBR|nr:hypothetical protein HNY73_020964 [Argiope bruennichi]